MEAQIYVFGNGLQIDLHKIICIGAIDKSLDGTIFMPIFCTGFNKAIHITLGNAIGKVDEQQKERITKIHNDFVEAWNLYTIQESKK